LRHVVYAERLDVLAFPDLPEAPDALDLVEVFVEFFVEVVFVVDEAVAPPHAAKRTPTTQRASTAICGRIRLPDGDVLVMR
jgi:hypothetical protein